MGTNSWNEVDRMLEEMGKLDLEIGIHTSVLAEKLFRLLGEHVEVVGPLQAERKELEDMARAVCTLQKAEFTRKRSKQLVYGKIAFRVSERIEFDEGLEAVIIAALKRLGHNECVIIKEAVDKNAAKQLADNELTKCGLRRAKEDHFRIEPNLKAIAESIGKDYAPGTVKLDIEKLCKLVPAPGAEEAAA